MFLFRIQNLNVIFSMLLYFLSPLPSNFYVLVSISIENKFYLKNFQPELFLTNQCRFVLFFFLSFFSFFVAKMFFNYKNNTHHKTQVRPGRQKNVVETNFDIIEIFIDKETFHFNRAKVAIGYYSIRNFYNSFVIFSIEV